MGQIFHVNLLHEGKATAQLGWLRRHTSIVALTRDTTSDTNTCGTVVLWRRLTLTPTLKPHPHVRQNPLCSLAGPLFTGRIGPFWAHSYCHPTVASCELLRLLLSLVKWCIIFLIF